MLIISTTVKRYKRNNGFILLIIKTIKHKNIKINIKNNNTNVEIYIYVRTWKYIVCGESKGNNIGRDGKADFSHIYFII